MQVVINYKIDGFKPPNLSALEEFVINNNNNNIFACTAKIEVYDKKDKEMN